MAHLEIDGGIVKTATLTNATGTHPLLTEIGQWRFFIDAVDDDGARTCLGDFASYGDAILQAESLSKEFGPVVDRIVDIPKHDGRG